MAAKRGRRQEIIKELEKIKDSKEEVKDRFYKDLTFGTKG